MNSGKAFLSIRVDHELRDELQKASGLEHRSLSSFSRLLLEYAWNQYLAAGSVRELLSNREQSTSRRE
jgi:hypothetical protein